MSYGYGLTAHPTNPNELYFMSRGRNAIYKFTVNSNGTGRTINWQKGRYGYNKQSTATQNYFYYPWGIHYDDDKISSGDSPLRSSTISACILSLPFALLFFALLYPAITSVFSAFIES